MGKGSNSRALNQPSALNQPLPLRLPLVLLGMELASYWLKQVLQRMELSTLGMELLGERLKAVTIGLNPVPTSLSDPRQRHQPLPLGMELGS